MYAQRGMSSTYTCLFVFRTVWGRGRHFEERVEKRTAPLWMVILKLVFLCWNRAETLGKASRGYFRVLAQTLMFSEAYKLAAIYTQVSGIFYVCA